MTSRDLFEQNYFNKWFRIYDVQDAWRDIEEEISDVKYKFVMPYRWDRSSDSLHVKLVHWYLDKYILEEDSQIDLYEFLKFHECDEEDMQIISPLQARGLLLHA